MKLIGKGRDEGEHSWKELREVQDEGTNHEEKFLCEQDGQAGNHLHPKLLSTASKVRVTGEPSRLPLTTHCNIAGALTPTHLREILENHVIPEETCISRVDIVGSLEDSMAERRYSYLTRNHDRNLRGRHGHRGSGNPGIRPLHEAPIDHRTQITKLNNCRSSDGATERTPSEREKAYTVTLPSVQYCSESLRSAAPLQHQVGDVELQRGADPRLLARHRGSLDPDPQLLPGAFLRLMLISLFAPCLLRLCPAILSLAFRWPPLASRLLLQFPRPRCGWLGR